MTFNSLLSRPFMNASPFPGNIGAVSRGGLHAVQGIVLTRSICRGCRRAPVPDPGRSRARLQRAVAVSGCACLPCAWRCRLRPHDHQVATGPHPKYSLGPREKGRLSGHAADTVGNLAQGLGRSTTARSSAAPRSANHNCSTDYRHQHGDRIGAVPAQAFTLPRSHGQRGFSGHYTTSRRSSSDRVSDWRVNRSRRGQLADKRGRLAEEIATVALINDGWTILRRRLRKPAGEIDLIAEKDGLLVGVGGKARASLADAAYALTKRQQARLLAATDILLATNPDWGAQGVRFDMLLVDPAGVVRRIADAFRGGD